MQTEPMIMHPAAWTIDEPIVGAEAVYRQIRHWLADLGIELGRGSTAARPAPRGTAIASRGTARPARPRRTDPAADHA